MLLVRNTRQRRFYYKDDNIRSVNQKRVEIAEEITINILSTKLSCKVLGVRLFGSVQTGKDNQGSDIDIAIETEEKVELIEIRSTRSRFEDEVDELRKELMQKNPGEMIHVTICSQELMNNPEFNGPVLSAIRKGLKLG